MLPCSRPLPAEFSYWLRKKKGVYFDSLKAEDTRPAFDKFVKKWNAGDLSAKYYDAGGSGGSKEEEAKTRTMYKWKFASKLGKSDQKAQESLRSEVSSAKTVDMQTGAALVAPSVLESTSRGGGGGRVGAAAAAGGGGPVVKKRVLGPSAPPREMLQDYSRALKRKDDHDFRKHKEMVVDELSGGRPTGRDAKMEKKMIGRQARSDRDASPEAGGGSAGGSASMYVVQARTGPPLCPGRLFGRPPRCHSHSHVRERGCPYTRLTCHHPQEWFDGCLLSLPVHAPGLNLRCGLAVCATPVFFWGGL